MRGHYRPDLRVESHKDSAQGLQFYWVTKFLVFLFICLVQHPYATTYVLNCVSLVALEAAHASEQDSTRHKGDLVRSSYLLARFLFSQQILDRLI